MTVTEICVPAAPANTTAPSNCVCLLFFFSDGEKLELLHPVPGIHVAMRSMRERRKNLFKVGPFARAISAREDIALRYYKYYYYNHFFMCAHFWFPFPTKLLHLFFEITTLVCVRFGRSTSYFFLWQEGTTQSPRRGLPCHPRRSPGNVPTSSGEYG